VNGNTLRLALVLIGVLVGINVTITGWVAKNVVELKERMATQTARVTAMEDVRVEESRLSDRDRLETRSDLQHDIDTHDYAHRSLEKRIELLAGAIEDLTDTIREGNIEVR
jgi:hypothetical protein